MNRFPLILTACGMLMLAMLSSCQPPAEPEQENVVYARLANEPDQLIPVLTTNTTSRAIYEQLYLPLVDVNPYTYEWEPALTKGRPEVKYLDDGGTAYTYELYDGITWSDGQPLTVADFEFTFKILFNLNIQETASQRPQYLTVRSIEVDPDNPLRFTVTTSDRYILGEATISFLSPLPHHALDPNGLLRDIPLAQFLEDTEGTAELPAVKQFAERLAAPGFGRQSSDLIGSGPFVFRSWEDGQYIVVAQNENWWINDLPGGHPTLQVQPDSVVFKIIPDQVATLAALKEGSIDAVTTLDTKDFNEFSASDFGQENYNFFNPNQTAWYYIALNNRDPLLADKRVRRALAHLLDIDAIIERVYYGYGTRTVGPILPSKDYYAKDLPLLEMDLDKATALLTEAGWTDTNGNGTVDKEIDGETVEMELEYLLTPNSRFASTMSSLLKDAAEKVGINITITQKEGRVLMTEHVAPRNYQMFGLGASGYPFPDDLYQLWHTSSNQPRGGNRVQFGNAETDALVEKVRVTLDDEERKQLYLRFQEIIYEEQPMIFLFSPQDRIAISKRFKAEPYGVWTGYRPRDFVLAE